MQSLLAQYNISVYRIVRGPFDDIVKKSTSQQCLSSKGMHKDDWILQTDSDELQLYGSMSLTELIEDCERTQSVAVFGRMKDHISRSGELVDIQHGQDLWQQFPLKCDITLRISRGQTSKVMLHKGDLEPRGGGHHFLKTRPRSFKNEGAYPREFEVHHFKWTKHVAYELQRRVDTNYKYQSEASAIMDHFKRHGGKFCTSCKSTNCHEFIPPRF
eukprot:TRINITY_DN584_c0_g1_i2.p1 TRINITY_DN584_c0_g1~~TRINITY_DN584_c0_g1_i2.p1  ORF type:complete len:215 (+),score=48.82 TRINITY_DN584_c0_g1_i2:557-1201(+)